MEFPLWLLLIALAAYALKAFEQRQRIGLLGRYLRRYQLEKLMEGLTGAYLRALDEDDPQRSVPIWRTLESTEATLGGQLDRLAKDIGAMGTMQARVSTLPLALPWAAHWFPVAVFDLRLAVALHAQGFAGVARNVQGLSRRKQAHMLTAELFLFQHTCHWYCRSRAVASARMWVRHQTSYEQVRAAVSPATRLAYDALVRPTAPRRG
jgi:hypothetical protein